MLIISSAVIVSSPKSVNIAENSNALVTCTAICSFINWEVNRQPLNHEFRDQGFQELSTIVTAHEKRDHSPHSVVVLCNKPKCSKN